jgi:hypothetical protein
MGFGGEPDREWAVRQLRDFSQNVAGFLQLA